MATKKGKTTYIMDNPPSVVSYAAVGSKKESEGPMAEYFDVLCEDTAFGEQTWEKAESRMQKDAANKALEKAKLCSKDIDLIFAGDLLNQCTSSTFGLRELEIPYLGVYGACSTMAEAMALGALLVDGGAIKRTMAVTSSHFCTAERLYRFPLEYGGQRTPTSQWTVTASGAAVIAQNCMPPYIKSVSIGSIKDMGIKDANNMGAAMAPAAVQTLKTYFEDTLTSPDNFDMIITGDLGTVGSMLFSELLKQEGYDISKNHADCGVLIYDIEKQDVHAGGSGCGCSASILTSYILPNMRKGELNEVLFMATGALLSTTTTQQGEAIPAIAHLIHLSTDGKKGGF